jgi:hypothetical protein
LQRGRKGGRTVKTIVERGRVAFLEFGFGDGVREGWRLDRLCGEWHTELWHVFRSLRVRECHSSCANGKREAFVKETIHIVPVWCK